MAAAPATAGSSKPASVPLKPLPRPQTLVADGARLDGRGLEEFRALCERRRRRRAARRRDAAYPRPATRATARTQARRRRTSPHPLSQPSFPAAQIKPSAVLDTRVISRAAGSAYAEFSSTKVMAAV
jgi:hypothetical protein